MKKLLSLLISATVAVSAFAAMPALAAEEKAPKYQAVARQMEKLNRGLIAVKTSEAPSNGVNAGVALSWRLLGDESLTNQAFDIYRNGVKIYTTGAHDATYYLDRAGTESSTYKVVKKGATAAEVAAEPAVKVWKEHVKYARGSYVGNGTSKPNAFSYVDVPLVRPENIVNAGGRTSMYYSGNAGANDASVGDLDGDGDYEIVLKWDPNDSKDSAGADFTGNVYIDAYEISENNGGYMWRIDLGKNVTAGAHYTQFMVYDFDGDGKSEIAMKTAPGSIDGQGNYVSEVGDTDEIRNVDNTALFIGTEGRLKGKNPFTQYLTIFDGETGAALYTTEFIPYEAAKDPYWGDGSAKYNRSERYLAAVAYLDGVHPSIIMCRGYYHDAIVRAYNWDGSELTMLWEHNGSSKNATSLYGQGNHNLAVADIDNDGKDEIVYGSAALDDNGVAMGNTYLGHGDAMHVSDFNNDGVQEVFSVKEDSEGYKTAAEHFRVAATGETLYAIPGSGDTGRGVMANIDDEYAKTHPNALALGWSTAKSETHDLTGAVVNTKPGTNSRGMTNFLVYWDGDLSREMLDDNQLATYDAEHGWTIRFYNDGSGYLPGSSNNDSKATPSLVADIWGDWREEIIMPIGKGEVNGVPEQPYLRIMTSVLPTTYRLTTLMHDSQYRVAIAWQNVAYNQPPHASYYIGSAALAVNSAGVTQNYLAPAVPYTVPYYAEGIPVEGMELNESSVTIKEGQSYRIAAKLYPENATKKGIIWESDNENVARVAGGNITGVGEGTCTITATTRDGGFVDTCTVTVVPIEEMTVLDDSVFTSTSANFKGSVDSASLDAVERDEGAYFVREFTPYYENKATVSFRLNTGGHKLFDNAWNWEGHEYTFGIEFLDTYGNNILNVAQSYTTGAQATTARATDGGFVEIQSNWSASGEGEEPMRRSSTAWYVTLEFDYDNDTCTATIAGSDKLKKYTKVFPLNGMSFKTLRYWVTKDGDGYIKVGPQLTELNYTLTTAKADSAVQIVSCEGNSVKYLAYDKNEGNGVLIGAAYDENGALAFAESEEVGFTALPEYGEFTFDRSINGYKIGLYLWTEKNSLVPMGLSDKTAAVVKKLAPVAVAASQEPEANNPAKNSCDGDKATIWTSNGVQNIVYDLGGMYTIAGVNVAFAEYTDERYIPFEIYVSEDNIEWSKVYSGNSVVRSGGFMKFNANKVGRYVKVVVKGNTVSGWSSLGEVEIYGG